MRIKSYLYQFTKETCAVNIFSFQCVMQVFPFIPSIFDSICSLYFPFHMQRTPASPYLFGHAYYVSFQSNQSRSKACKFLLKMKRPSLAPCILCFHSKHTPCVRVHKRKENKTNPVISTIYMFWRHANNIGGYVKIFGEKKTSPLGGNILYLSIS